MVAVLTHNLATEGVGGSCTALQADDRGGAAVVPHKLSTGSWDVNHDAQF